MDIRKLIIEETDDMEWMKDIAKNSTVWEILNWKFGIYHQPNGITTYSYGEVETWLRIKKVSTRELFEIVTDTKWWKGIFGKTYWDLRKSLKLWANNNYYTMMAGREVQEYLSDNGTNFMGPG
jgi:hypothetical protein